MIVDPDASRRDPRQVDYGELPEVTRALRALGSPRRSSGAYQAAFFAPLIEARKRAFTADTPIARVRAFDASELGRELDRILERIALRWPDTRDAARRALRAELLDRVAAYSEALGALSQHAAAVVAADEGSKLMAWRRWTIQLMATFEAADRSWVAVSTVVDALPGSRS